MVSPTSKQLTRILTVSCAILGLTPSLVQAGAPIPRAAALQPRDAPPDSDQWLELLIQLLQGLKGMVDSSATTRASDDTSTLLMKDIMTVYETNGLPSTIDTSAGRAIVGSLYKHLGSDPGLLDESLRATFAQTLVRMYVDLRGDPVDLTGALP